MSKKYTAYYNTRMQKAVTTGDDVALNARYKGPQRAALSLYL
jgi:hypothetical protein